MCEYSPEIQLINAYYDIYKYIKGRDTHEHFMQVQGRQPTLIQASIVGYLLFLFKTFQMTCKDTTNIKLKFLGSHSTTNRIVAHATENSK